MRSFVVALITLSVTSCELTPPPKQQAPAAPAQGSAQGSATGSGDVPPPAPPPGAPEPAAVAIDAGAPPTPAPSPGRGSGSAAPAEPSPECLEIGSHIAATLIAAADPTQQAQLEQERTKIVRRSAEACTRDAWNAESRACFLAATTSAAMQDCGKKLRAP